MQKLSTFLVEYTPYNDPLLSFATHLHEKEEHTTSRRTLIESKPVGVTQLSMTAEVSPNGVITEVKVKNKFTTAKTEFQHLSSERAAESTDTETETDERKADTEDEEENSEISDEHEHLAEDQVDEVVNMNGNGEVTANGDLCSSLETDNATDNHFNIGSTSETDAAGVDVGETGENNNDITSNTVEHHNGEHDPDADVSKHTDVVNNAEDNSDDDEAVAASNKKPKLESLNDCDKQDFDPIGKK